MTFSRLPILFAATFGLLALGARGGCNIFGCDGPDPHDYKLTVAYTAQGPDGGVPSSGPCEGATDCKGKCPSPVDPGEDSLNKCSCDVGNDGTGATLTCNYHAQGAVCKTGG